MAWTKYADPNASQNVTGMLQYADSVSGGILFTLILFALFVVTFMTSYRYTLDIKKSFLASAWLSGIPAMLLFAGGLIVGTHALIFIIILVVAIIIQFIE